MSGYDCDCVQCCIFKTGSFISSVDVAGSNYLSSSYPTYGAAHLQELS